MAESPDNDVIPKRRNPLVIVGEWRRTRDSYTLS